MMSGASFETVVGIVGESELRYFADKYSLKFQNTGDMVYFWTFLHFFFTANQN